MESWFTLAEKESHAGSNRSCVMIRESKKKFISTEENKTIDTVDDVQTGAP